MSYEDQVAELNHALSLFDGNESALAKALNLKQQSVNDVFRAGRRAPVGWCIPLESITAEKARERGKGERPVSRHALRPDIYPLPHETPEEKFRAVS